MQKSGFVAITGRPSAGKSSILNVLTGHKVSIVAPVPQTTRNRVRGILTSDRGQLVFLDTPGFHVSDKKFNQHMKNLVIAVLADVDLVLYVVDSTRPAGDEEQAIIDLLKTFRGKIIIAVNKIDARDSRPGPALELLTGHFPAATIIKTSVETKEGMESLRTALFEAAPEGEPMYPDDYYTDQTPEFRTAEVIREKAILQTRQEVPHSLYVEIADMEVKEAENTLWIRAFLTVERESQKGILVGKGGEKIRTIRMAAQKELNKIFSQKTHLDLRVKVNPKWRSKDALLRRLVQ